MAGFNELTNSMNASDSIESMLVFLLGLPLEDIQVRLCLVGVFVLCCLVLCIRLAWWWYGPTINATMASEIWTEDSSGYSSDFCQSTSSWSQSSQATKDSVANRTRAKRRNQLSDSSDA
jgi:hypothetical protein